MSNLMWFGPPSSCELSETLPLVLMSSMLDSMRLMEVYSIPFWPWSGANVMPACIVLMLLGSLVLVQLVGLQPYACSQSYKGSKP